jgi:hypothetical protein
LTKETIIDNQQVDTSNTKKSNNLLIYVAVVLLLGLSGVVYLWQHNKVAGLNKEVAALKATQLPQKKYSSYKDCTNNGGVILNTINGQFNACLGGNEDESGELPQYQAFLQYSSQNLPRITERKISKTENRVDNTSNHSADLVAFLKQDYTGCKQGYYKIIQEVTNRYALLNYGCAQDKSALKGRYHIIAMKLGDGWVLLSPTNNMDEKGQPSCLLQDMFRISKELAPKCFENTGYDNGKLKERNYQ